MVCMWKALRRTATTPLVSAIIVLAGCSAARNGGPVLTAMPLTDPSIQRGKMVYDANCHSCHLQGQGGMAPALNNKPLPKFLISFQVRNGLGVMPAFSEQQISDRELEDLVNYVAALRQHTG